MINDKKQKCYLCHKMVFVKKPLLKMNKRFKSLFYPLLNNIYNFTLINPCKCNNKNVHPICIILDFIKSFKIKCEICNYVYNINITQLRSKTKMFYISVTLFIIFILIILGFIFCILLIFVNNFLTSNKKFYPTKVFLGIFIFVIILILSLVLIIKRKRIIKKSYTYQINFLEYRVNTQNIINYELLNNFYYWLYKKKIPFLIEIKESHNFFEKNIENRNLNLLKFIELNNLEYQVRDKLIIKKSETNRTQDSLQNIIKKTEKSKAYILPIYEDEINEI